MKPFLPLITLLLITPAFAGAATFYVTKTNDTADGVCDEDCSLREAVQAANQTPGADSIQLPDGTYTITLLTTESDDPDDGNSGDFDISDPVSVYGASMEGTIIDANGQDRVLDVLDDAGNVLLRKLTIKGGLTDGTGGGIQNRADLTLKYTLIYNNAVSGSYDSDTLYGGGIASYGPLAIYNSEFAFNYGTSWGQQGVLGGAIYSTAPLHLKETLFDGNWSHNLGYAQGGAVYSTGTLTVRDSDFESNSASATDTGGGAVTSQGSSDIRTSGFTANRLISDEGTTLPGMAVRHEGSGELKLYSSTLTGQSYAAAMEDEDAGLTVNASVVSIDSTAISRISDSAITSNQGDGLDTGSSTVYVSNSTIENN